MRPPPPPCPLPNEPIPRVPPDVLVKLILKMLRESLVGNAQLMGLWTRTLLSFPPCSHSGSSRSVQGQELEGPGGDAAGPPPPGTCRALHGQLCSVISSSARFRLQFLRTSQLGATVRQAGSTSDAGRVPAPVPGQSAEGTLGLSGKSLQGPRSLGRAPTYWASARVGGACSQLCEQAPASCECGRGL